MSDIEAVRYFFGLLGVVAVFAIFRRRPWALAVILVVVILKLF